MNISIRQTEPQTTFTNGEVIHGTVVLHCLHPITLWKINVVLVGETKSALTGTSGLLLRRKNEEKHRFACSKQDLFLPIPHLDTSRQAQVKLGPGNHSFPFSLQIPWYAECPSCTSKTPVTYSDTVNHSARCLPPSMTDLVKGADVTYKITASVTATRNMFKSTTQFSQQIRIWPCGIQSQLTGSPDAFTALSVVEADIASLHTSSSSTKSLQDHSEDTDLLSSLTEPARILITASFPEDYTLSCRSEISMHLMVKKINSFASDLYLQSFQAMLVGYTDIRAGSVSHGQITFWMIQSLSNIGLKLFSDDEDAGAYKAIDPSLWQGKPLPDSVVPSFTSCNVDRRYELEILMGFQCGSPKQSRTLFIQLRTPVQLISGLRPKRGLKTNEQYTDNMSGFDCDHDEPFHGSSVANGLTYSDDTGFPDDRLHQEGSKDAPPLSAPPSYDEAVRDRANDRFSGKGIRPVILM